MEGVRESYEEFIDRQYRKIQSEVDKEFASKCAGAAKLIGQSIELSKDATNITKETKKLVVQEGDEIFDIIVPETSILLLFRLRNKTLTLVEVCYPEPCQECRDIENNKEWNKYWIVCPWCGRRVK
jgi:hypothetical protein